MASKARKGDSGNVGSARKSPGAGEEKWQPKGTQQKQVASVVQRVTQAGVSLTPRDVLHLQRNIGNRAVARLISEGRPESAIQRRIERGKLNIVGEKHGESDARREKEITMIGERYGFSFVDYWLENQLIYAVGHKVKYGESAALLIAQRAAYLLDYVHSLKGAITEEIDRLDGEGKELHELLPLKGNYRHRLSRIWDENILFRHMIQELDSSSDRVHHSALLGAAKRVSRQMQVGLIDCERALLRDFFESRPGEKPAQDPRQELVRDLRHLVKHPMNWEMELRHLMGYLDEKIRAYKVDPDEVEDQVRQASSNHMLAAAQEAAENNTAGVWKVGDTHVKDMAAPASDKLTLTREKEFNAEFTAWEKEKGMDKAGKK